MPNRLAGSSSPYLRQHQNNPVDWFPWCDEAFAKAKSEDKAIFLSVGYSACHWCHVMEHESFENQEIAAILNEHFVAIKVDREERPDVDQIYMQAVQMLTGSGGWPMSVFMSHDGQPFYGGTYWPPDSRHGRPGFGQVLLAIAGAWKNKRDELDQQSKQITEHLQAACRGPDSVESSLTVEWINAAEQWLLQHHDSQHGGFGGAPKFPHAMDLSLLVELCADDPREERSTVVITTLDKMARGGIYDHLGGGFARYSVDDRWLVPHFEKMLYDNALLASVYADAYRQWSIREHAQVVRETLDYVMRDMPNDLGGYHSTEDADSEGVEGKFYVWTRAEIVDVLGAERGREFCDCYDVTDQGNFEGTNILNLPVSVDAFARQRQLDHPSLERQFADDRVKLLRRREERVRPALDDKVLLSWNALMIGAMVRGYRALDDQRYLDSARGAVSFLTNHMRSDDGRFWHTWRDGASSLDAYLDDYTYFLDALVELFCVDSNIEYLQLAIELAERIVQDFSDPDGGFYFTSNEHERLIARGKDMSDSSVPSGNAMAASGLLTLARLTGRDDFRKAAERALVASSGVMAASPQAAGHALRVLNRILKPSEEVVLVYGDNDRDVVTLIAPLLRRLVPTSITLICHERTIPMLQSLCPLLQQRKLVGGRATLFVCADAVCQQPLTGNAIVEFLKGTAERDA